MEIGSERTGACSCSYNVKTPRPAENHCPGDVGGCPRRRGDLLAVKYQDNSCNDLYLHMSQVSNQSRLWDLFKIFTSECTLAELLRLTLQHLQSCFHLPHRGSNVVVQGSMLGVRAEGRVVSDSLIELRSKLPVHIKLSRVSSSACEAKSKHHLY